MMFVFVSLLLCMGSFISGGLASGLNEDVNMRSCDDKERQALLDFKANLVDINNSLHDWGNKNKDCCQWVGVGCDTETGHVIELNVATSTHRRLYGNISSLLPLLNQLERLDFQLNHIPSSLSSLTNLLYLNLSAANLSGPIPHQLANLSNLLHLDLSSNFLTGSIPASFGDLTSLTHLDLSGNRLESVIPKSFGNLSSLVHLDLSKNHLNGSVPNFAGCSFMKEPISHSNSLQKLDLSRNRLTGTLPNTVGKLSNLEYLDVSSNSLEGLISDDHFLNLTQLTYLDLSFNLFALNLSSHVKFPFKLKTIKMQACKVGPSFPMWIQNQRYFAYLDISNASISDCIPGWFWNLPPGLKFLNLSSNEIKGMLPNMTSVFEGYPGMDLSYNQLEGTIPALPSKLAALNLSGNRFSGTLSFLCQIDISLTLLDLSNNLLSGSLPDCWQKFQKKLVVLNLSNNSLSGEIPSSLGFLSQLQALYLRRNAFVGEVPMSMSSCTKLRFVDLGENKLSGNIPTWIGERLSELYVLVLQSNRLDGSLPSQICLLNNLQFLDLSMNGLSGYIPRCFGNFTAMATRGSQDDITSHSYSSYEAILAVASQISYKLLQVCAGQDGRYSSCEESNEEALFIDKALVAWKGTRHGDEFWKSYYTSIGAGFAVGFWGICSALILDRGYRHFLFASLNNMKDWIYVLGGSCILINNVQDIIVVCVEVAYSHG
ncbi:hypothetical protein L1987_75387 [Smallanthus sonchifolius]|uniref:Uncharacterized protein n=1 Tax=Smallanthus sonchifolius TaxID=185202 RepID=A0ACB9A5B1_9ASTR|nr:hypothetical protein L1987_75387 [Smallanthus sonchifolius]